MVSKPTYVGGLGFSYKWNMGWMHDMLKYFEQDPIHRAYHHNKVTFGMMYAYSENYILAFSHDEVVHLKKSMLGKMPGDTWKKFANLRLLYGFMIGHPGKKLLYMGQEFGQWSEWNHDSDLQWELLETKEHKQLQDWMRDLLHLYNQTPELHELDYDSKGFEWIDCNDSFRSVVSFIRWGKERKQATVLVFNFTPIPRFGYLVGVPWGGEWKEILNSDAEPYGGSGMGNYGAQTAEEQSVHGRPASLNLTLPPLAALIFQSEKPETVEEA
jgi:1,4-alpha-glucan branching enzyme